MFTFDESIKIKFAQIEEQLGRDAFHRDENSQTSAKNSGKLNSINNDLSTLKAQVINQHDKTEELENELKKMRETLVKVE